jgi:hypothetical protein
VPADADFPVLRQVVLDATDAPDDETPDWLVLREPGGSQRVAVQLVDRLPLSTWPTAEVPQQLHLDLTVGSKPALDAQHQRALELGARLLLDRSDDEREPLRVYADPAGHPFSIFVAG